MSVLILGGYGTFGGRLVELLADDDRLTLIVAGRSLEKAKKFCASLSPRAELVPCAFDREGDVEQQLKQIGPNAIVDASGPFQSYGADPYRIVNAALALGIDYLDLADGSAFVKGIAQFDADARVRRVFILSGVSSFPVLTAAVVRQLSEGMARVNSIVGGIAPSPYAGVGPNVIRAIAGYAGQPIEIIRDGSKSVGYPFAESRRYTIAPPGRLPLKPTLFSLVDVPDLKVLPDLWPEVRTVWMGAGPVPEILHHALNLLAWGVRWKIFRSLSPLAELMHRVTNTLRWGEHRGGMFVTIEGAGRDGQEIERSWHLLAEGDDGPFIPSMAAAAIIRKCLNELRPAPGARPAATDLELDDYRELFARRKIYFGQRSAIPDQAPLHRRILADAWMQLPGPLREMHDVKGQLTARGTARVDRGKGMLARLAAWLIRFPREGRDVPVEVLFRAHDGRETWQRTFAGHAFSSVQEQGRDRFDGLMCERFGPLKFGLALVLEGGRLNLVLRRWSFLGLALPVGMAPRGTAYESAEDGRFNFHVEIGHPLTGLIVRYQGWLVPAAAATPIAAAP